MTFFERLYNVPPIASVPYKAEKYRRARADTKAFREEMRPSHSPLTHHVGLLLSTCVELYYAGQLNDALWCAQPVEDFSSAQHYSRNELDEIAEDLYIQQQAAGMGDETLRFGIVLAEQAERATI